MCVRFFFSISPLGSAFRLHFGCNNSGEWERKKKMQFRSDCECKQNNGKSYSLLVRCHYCLWYFCYHIALFRLHLSEWVSHHATAPHHQCHSAFEEKAFSCDLHITHLFHLLLLFGGFSLFVKHFCTLVAKIQPYVKVNTSSPVVLRYSVILFWSHFSATLFRIQSSDLAKFIR